MYCTYTYSNCESSVNLTAFTFIPHSFLSSLHLSLPPSFPASFSLPLLLPSLPPSPQVCSWMPWLWWPGRSWHGKLTTSERPSAKTSSGQSMLSHSVTIPVTLQSLFQSFSLCSSHSSVTIPVIQSLFQSLFSHYSSHSVSVPVTLQSLFQSFSLCSSHSSVTIPATLQSLFQSFSLCSSHSSVTIPVIQSLFQSLICTDRHSM